MQRNISSKNCILIIDDDFINRELLKNIFSAQFTFEEAVDGEEGLEQIHKCKDKLCAIILDVQMPKFTGIELLKIISKEGVTEDIPTFLITAQDDDELVTEAYNLGVVDVVSKPVTPIVIERRVKTVIELFSAREVLSATVAGQEEKLIASAKEIEELNKSTVEALSTAIEFRDVSSGEHVNRIYAITKCILAKTPFGENLSYETIENIARGSIMHDVGKIAISDIILNKPGKLTKEEFEIMKTHTVKGEELILQISKNQTKASYVYAADIARHHHERWDGRGYPDGLKGEEISIAAQVSSIADVYDALISTRVYKKAFTCDQAVDMIKNGECGVFNPKLIECFLQVEPVIRKWYTEKGIDETLKNISNEEKQDDTSHFTAAGTIENEEVNTVLDVMLLISAVQSAYDMVISVNLTKNTYHMIDYNRFKTHCAENEGKFDDLIEIGSQSIPISYRKEFVDTFCRANLFKAWEEGKKTVVLEHQQYSDDGQLHWVETTVLFVEDERSGDLLEITLAQYIDEKHEQRQKTHKILTDALALAEQANSAKYDFLSKMSHDIRTPLNSIIGMTTIISAHLDDKQKISDCLVKIGRSSKYLLGIINDILDYTKIENKTLSLNLSDFKVRDLITDVTEEANALATLKGQTFTVTVDEKVGNSYVGDEYRIRQIIMNLIDNAHKYTPEKKSFSLDVSIRYTAEEYDILTFTVSDTGTGIAPEFLLKIFEPFAQDEGSDRVNSLGLGLPISRNLAHLMNGDLNVASEVGKGSTFTLEIPMEKGKLTDSNVLLDSDINVLVVDDEEVICEHTSILLKKMGISAEIALEGKDAVNMVKNNLGTENEFDVAIIDWKMSEMDGLETVKHIRKEVGKDVLVIVMSAYDWGEIEDEARAVGVDLFIAKPITEMNLRTAIACSERMRREQKNIIFNGEKILVAEDNELNVEIAKAIFEMKNLRVDVAQNGKIAYETFVASKEGEYLAILMDVMMPVMNGHEATRAIRSSNHPESKTIPIYALTANAFRNDILEAKIAGMNGHISKPVDYDEVARILHGIVKSKQ